MSSWYQRPSDPPRRTLPLLAGVVLSAGMLWAAWEILNGWPR